jgi:predicted dehydrogenase
MTVNCNIALVGCGAIAKGFYLPAFARHRNQYEKVWLVDPNDAALAAANSIVSGHSAHSLSEIDDKVHYVVVATPNGLHSSVAREALLCGADILIEKPYVVWPTDGHELIRLATARDRLIAINQTRRFFPHASELRQRIASGEFGALKSILHVEGEKLAWPIESGAGFKKDAQRTGVIMDLGVHVIDFYHYILQPVWTLDSAIHDGFQGPEGLAAIELRANGAPVTIRLSRYIKQKNVAHLEFEHARVHINVYDLNAYAVERASGSIERVIVSPTIASYDLLADPLMADFLAAGLSRDTPRCDAASTMPVIELLDKIYLSAGRYPAKIGAV